MINNDNKSLEYNLNSIDQVAYMTKETIKELITYYGFDGMQLLINRAISNLESMDLVALYHNKEDKEDKK